ncbi:MAG TPA: DMT family transporter [Synergistaceae bacterium]|nr:DMT family transporter [Synergistaceae bacterium]
MDPRKRMLAADAVLFLVAFFWGTSFVAMKAAVTGIPPFYLVGMRFLGGALCLSPFLFFRPWSVKDFKAGIVLGSFIFLGFFLQTLGLQYTTAGKQAFFTAIYVVLVPLLVWGLRRIFPGVRIFLAALCCFSGVALLGYQGSLWGGMNVGDWLSLAGAVFFAAHLIGIEHYVARGDVIVLVFFQILVAGSVSMFCALLFESWPEVIPSASWWSLGYAILFCTVLTFLVQNWAQRYTPSTHAAILLSLESLFGALVGVVVLHEVFTLPMVFGGLCIFAGVLLCEMGPLWVPLRRAVSRR